MASNPIVRRSRQSFFIGFLIALVIMAVVVVFLFMKINTLNEEKEALKIKEIEVYTLSQDLKSGDELTSDMLISKKVAADFEAAAYMTPYSFEIDEETSEPLKYFTKIDLKAGTLITPDMLYTENGLTASDERLVEYNMIVLPTQLINGNYIDVRLQLPNGQEYIVLPKKKVEQCTATTVWMKMTEIEMLTMNSAIVDAYRVNGATLRARLYTEPGMQETAAQSYAVSDDILTAINANPNILEDARKELVRMWSASSGSGETDFRSERNTINGYTVLMTDEQINSAVQSKVEEEITDIATMRDEYVSELEGTGMVGRTE